MAEIDTSSYPRPQAQPNMLDTAAKAQSLQSGALTIEKQQLDLMNQRYEYMIRSLNALPRDASIQDLQKWGQHMVTQGIVPAPMYANIVKMMPAGNDPAEIDKFRKTLIMQAASNQEAVNWHYGQQTMIDNGQTMQPARVSPQFGIEPTGSPIQKQVPPTMPVLGEGNQPILTGPQAPRGPEGTVPKPGGFSGQYNTPPNLNPLPVGRVNDPRVNGQSQGMGGNVTSVVAEPPIRTPIPVKTPNERIAQGGASWNAPITPAGPATGLPPGVAEAATVKARNSAEMLSKEQVAATEYPNEVFPLKEAIVNLEKLGTKGTGPGTETFNNIKSFILSNLPGVSEKDFAGLGDVEAYDKARKYLTQYVMSIGSTGTNDKLAAAFSGNPSTGISNAAAIDVTKSALALRRMKQAQYLEFARTGKPPEQFSDWSSQWAAKNDPRAFGVDMMSQEAKAKLLATLKKNPREMKRFENSLGIAHDNQLIAP